MLRLEQRTTLYRGLKDTKTEVSILALYDQSYTARKNAPGFLQNDQTQETTLASEGQ